MSVVSCVDVVWSGARSLTGLSLSSLDDVGEL